MLKIRIIPTLLYHGNILIKGRRFDSWRKIGALLPAIKVYNMRRADELIVLDITATKKGVDPDFELIKEFTQECFVPLTVGGGIKSIDDIRQILRSGADKVCINSFAYENCGFIKRAVQEFGSQCIVISIDVKKLNDGRYCCYSYSGTVVTGIDIKEWVRKIGDLGVGEILITNIDKDGMMQGYDLDLVKLVADSVKIPVIASGGAGGLKDFADAIKIGAKAVAASSIFNFTDKTPMMVKKYLLDEGFPVRL